MTERENRTKAELVEYMKALVTHGYTAYTVDGSAYGYLITPQDNVLYVQAGYFGGWEFSLQYPPSKANGTGCGCLKEPALNVDLETVQLAEREGLAFASKLRAKLYSSSEAWRKSYWQSDKLMEVRTDVQS